MDKTHEQVEKRLIALAYAKDFDEVMEERMVLTLSLSDSVANEAKHMILRYQKLLPPSTVQYWDRQGRAGTAASIGREPGLLTGQVQLYRGRCKAALPAGRAAFACLHIYNPRGLLVLP